MNKKTTQEHFTQSSAVLYLAFELSNKNWKLGFSIGLGQKARIRTIDAGEMVVLKAEMRAAKKRFHLPDECEVVSCYEAGRDGFWLHRFLTAEKITNYIVDSASIEVNRRKRRAKADRLDTESLLRMLIRYCGGEQKVWSVIRVPSAEEEDRRQLHRELSALEKEKNRTGNRIRGLLATQGIRLEGALDLADERLESIRMWDGRPLAPGLKSRIGREWAHLVFLKAQISTLTRARQSALRGKKQPDVEPDLEKMRQLERLRAIGPVGAWVLVREVFGWRHFKNRRQVGSLSGLTPTPYQSGNSNFEQGISKAGIRQVREIAIELAWAWLRYQPNSKLSGWYNARFANGGKKARKVGIVALARRLLIELWRYLETGALPEGAGLKIAAYTMV
jgi:transposase